METRAAFSTAEPALHLCSIRL